MYRHLDTGDSDGLGNAKEAIMYSVGQQISIRMLNLS